MELTWYQILCLAGLPTLSTLIVTTVFNHIQNNSKKSKETKRKELREDIKAVVQSEVEPIKTDIKDLKEGLKCTREGIQAELRHDIRNSCRRCIVQGYRTEDDTIEVIQMHEKYETLGSNGVTNSLYESFLRLKLVPNDYQEVSKKKKVLNEKNEN